jgi:CBS domain containing-hemolysin-like protein
MSAYDITVRLLGVVALVVLNGFFVAAEFALVGARRARLDQLALAGDGGAALGRRLQEQLDRSIAAAQLGITLASLALGWIGESTIAALVEPPIEHLLTDILSNAGLVEQIAAPISSAVGIGVAFFIITTLHIVFGEQAPKIYAIHEPEQVTRFIAYPLYLFDRIFAPIVRFLDGATVLVLRVAGIQDTSGSHGRVHSSDELRLLVEESGEAGILDEQSQEMLINVFAFGQRPAYQAMVSRMEVVTIDSDDTVQAFLDRFAHTGHTRFPVLGPGGVDDVQGIVSAKDLLLAVRTGAVDMQAPIANYKRPAFFTPEAKHIGDLLREMRDQHQRMAILIDEYGGMAGVVTLEDLIEEIIGDIDDNLQDPDQNPQQIDDRTTVVEGQMRLEDVNQELGLNFPTGDYETLAGFVLAKTGRIPAPNDVITHDGVRLTIVEMQGPRIKRIEVTRI